MRVAVGQFGGPTPVLNASLHGVLGGLAEAGAEAVGIRGGAAGLLRGDLVPLGGPGPAWLLQAPGAALGAGRHRPGPGDPATMAAVLRGARADAAILIGGNGTMALAQAIGGDLAVIGVPKTIDNDLVGTDHTPGYPSAASFVARAVRDLADDLVAMAGFEDVRLIEVMGRRAGWLAGAAALARRHRGDLPQVILLPEVPVDVAALAAEIAAHHRRDGSVLVVVAEGVVDGAGRALGLAALDASGQTAVLGSAATALAQALRQRLPLTIRAESLGFLPRCLRTAATSTDRAVAAALGRRAAAAATAGRGGLMVASGPREAGSPRGPLVEVPLADVCGRERPLPAGMRDLQGPFADWLRPLLDIPETWPPARFP